MQLHRGCAGALRPPCKASRRPSQLRCVASDINSNGSQPTCRSLSMPPQWLAQRLRHVFGHSTAPCRTTGAASKLGSPSYAQSSSSSGSGVGNNGGQGGSGGGGGQGDGSGSSNNNDDEDSKVLSLTEVEALALAKGVRLPADMLELAAKYGLRASALAAYFTAQLALVKVWHLSLLQLAHNGLQGGVSGFLVRTVPYMRDRILADNMFLFKVGAEVVIDSGCATVAEVRKRGKDFWAEFDFYLSDLVVGLVLDVALVSLMAPAAVLGGASRAAMTTGWLQRALASVPSAVFEANIRGVKSFSLGSRVACLGVKFLEYSLAGISCGLVGQGVCNAIMHLKRSIHGTKEDDVAVPPLMKTALVWGLFMGLSSNIRYQVVYGLERVVDLTVAKHVPAVAYGSTLAIRFVNNVIGGENFIDMARWAGVQ
ncbi:hypothetical protein QJQ45_020839 [Haematococcus lacustris]|nr:hypothetical protein QJQ45_020839 [Haematococcus lacustris]